jgi:hypothetical protein
VPLRIDEESGVIYVEVKDSVRRRR